MLECWQSGFVISPHVPHVSFFDLPLWGRRQKRTRGEQYLDCCYCDLLDLQRFAKLRKISLGKMLLNKALCMAFLFHSQVCGLAPEYYCLKREKWSEICHLLRKQREEEKWRKISFLIPILCGPKCSTVQPQHFHHPAWADGIRQ